MSNDDLPETLLRFHRSFSSLLSSFGNIITSLIWLKVSNLQAEQYFRPYPYVVMLNCTVSDQAIKIDKSIFALVANEGFNEKTPLYTNSVLNFCRLMTIALKDVVWNEPDFKSLLERSEFQFLRHIRNASAHENSFFFGEGRQRIKTLEMLPVTWRNKVISDSTEGHQLYMDFMGAGDLLFLLSDISALVL